jgi:hypothetical protein
MTTKKKKTTAKKKIVKRAVPNGGKSAKVIALLQRPQGVTRKQILQVTGWKAVSVQALAKSAGVKLKIDKKVKGQPLTYRVQP